MQVSSNDRKILLRKMPVVVPKSPDKRLPLKDNGRESPENAEAKLISCQPEELPKFFSRTMGNKRIKSVEISKSNGSCREHTSSVNLIKLYFKGSVEKSLDSNATVKSDSNSMCIEDRPNRQKPSILTRFQRKSSAKSRAPEVSNGKQLEGHAAPKSALDEFLESIEQNVPTFPQQLISQTNNISEALQLTGKRLLSTESKSNPYSAYTKLVKSPSVCKKTKVNLDHQRKMQLSERSAISPYLHFIPNGRVAPLLNPNFASSESTVIHPQSSSTEISEPCQLSLDSIFNEVRRHAEQPALFPNRKDVSICDVKNMMKKRQLKTNPSLDTYMGRDCKNPDKDDVNYINKRSVLGKQAFFAQIADAMVVVTPDRGEEKKRNALEMLAYSEPAKKAASKRPREDTSSSNSYSHPALTADPSAKRAMRSMRKTANDNRQLVLDFGQKNFGARWCKSCGFVYTPSHPDDLKLHEKYHNKKTKLLKYTLKGNERVVGSFEDGCIIQVAYENTQNVHGVSCLSSEPVSHLERVVGELRERVDAELGFVEDSQDRLEPLILVFVSTNGNLVGYLLGEKIEWGFRVVADDTAACSSTSDPVSGTVTNARGEEEEIGRSWSCSLTPETADCGVSRIWVAPQVKRRHIATRMVNALRRLRGVNYEDGMLPKELLAFSDPTNAGRSFAVSYIGREDFLVFKCIQSNQPVRDFLKEQEERDKQLL